MHYKAYKPCFMLSQFVSNNRKQNNKKRFLSELYDFPKGVMPIGRLDEKSEGLLLFTTDGKLSDTINRSGIEKEYYAQLDGAITASAITQLSTGVTIGFEGKKYTTKACKVMQLADLPILPEPHTKLRLAQHRPSSWISITLKEGKFRQVRKMTAAVGYPTLRLVRVRIGNIGITDLRPEQVVPLDRKTIEGLKNGCSA